MDDVTKDPALPPEKSADDADSDELDHFLVLTEQLLTVSKKDLDAERKRERDTRSG